MRTYAGHSSAAGDQRAVPAQPGQGPDRPVGRLRPADPDRLRPRPRAGAPARSAGSACRSRTSATCGRSSTASRSADANTSMTINATGDVAARPLRHRRPPEQGAPLAAAGRHDAERHRQGVPVPRHLHLPAGPVAAADHRHRSPGRCVNCSEVEPGQHLLVPPPGGRRDAGAGGRLRAGHRGRRARRGARLRPGAGRADGRRRRSGSRSSSTPACGSSRRWRRCARSARCGTRSPRERYGVTDAAAAPVPVRRAGQLARPHRGAAGEQRPAHRAGDARRDAVPRRPGPRGAAARPGTRRSACPGRGTSSGRCGCSRCWRSSPTCSNTRTCSTARTWWTALVDVHRGRRPAPSSTRSLELGGVVAAVESGYLKSALVASLAERRRRMESGERRGGRGQPVRRDRAVAADRGRRRRASSRSTRRSRRAAVGR